MAERPSNRLDDIGKADFLGFDGDGAGFDLGQVENVADQIEQVSAGAVNGTGKVDLLERQILIGLSASCWPRIRMELSSVRSSWLILAGNSDLYLDVKAGSLAFSSMTRRACSIS